MTYILIGAEEFIPNKNTMKNKALVKVKIVLEDNGGSLVTYMWKKTFWIFGYWYPFGSSSCMSTGIQSNNKISKITDNNVSKVLYDNFINH